MNKKVLITGATGFLGKYLIDDFLKEGYTVHAFGRNEEVGKSLLKENVLFFKGDLENYEDVLRATLGCEIVVHAGAKSSPWGQYKEFYEANVIGTQNILKAATESRVKRLVHISTPSVYSDKKDQFMLSEEDAKKNNKLNYYIETKLMAEKLIEKFSSTFEWVILRPRGLFGIGDQSVIPRLMRANSKIGVPLFNDGKNLVDVTYVENVSYACVLATSQSDVHKKIFNITNGEPMEFKKLLEMFLKETNERAKFKKINYNVLYFVFSGIEKLFLTLKIKREPIITRYSLITLGYSQTLDITKAKRELAYEPLFTIEEGVKIYAKWYRENKVV